MQKTLRLIAILLLLMLIGALLYSRTQHTMLVRRDLAAEETAVKSQRDVAQIAARAEPASPEPQNVSTNPAAPQPQLGTESAPVMVKLLDAPHADETAERARDREIALGIERNTGRLASEMLSQNLLLVVLSALFFLMLLVLYMLMENVRKIALAAVANPAARTAQVADILRKSE